ncbi:hypothetical protein INT47_007111 [Mucor saturninus]|uniref:3'-5' exonuclease domain-containing protein n=1 Tax=Mucor saturninus TaxID=64648 RepID=A0A8H7QFS8_9FUNG|nr:hypothetical protein INT47_007111 [Mucor saturninus]
MMILLEVSQIITSNTPRLSDWSSTRLSESQITYAANDVYVSLEIFNILQHVTAAGTQIFENLKPAMFISIRLKGRKQVCTFGVTIIPGSKTLTV